MRSRRWLSARFMKNWVVREFFPDIAKVTKPGRLDITTGSSGIRASRQIVFSSGSPVMPIWAMKPSMTRNMAMSL